MPNGFAIALAWPETACKRAGAWYDIPMHLLGVSKKGYYKVGHAAIVLVNSNTGQCYYFDFGRYHAPHGFGRVRSAQTDYDLAIKTKAEFSQNRLSVTNVPTILAELYNNDSTHGSGVICGAITDVNFQKSLNTAKQLQAKEFIRYGPFVPKGTNCSRFVSSVLQAGVVSFVEKLKLALPTTISPTPMGNLRTLSNDIVRFDQQYAPILNSKNIDTNQYSIA